MPTDTSIHQPPPSEPLTTETVDASPNPHEVADQRKPSRSPSGKSSSRRAPQPLAARQRLTTTYIQGDFATGQRTLPLPIAPVGTFATRMS